MGGGISASSVNRLRKTILIRAYNLRQKDETLDEQFRSHAKRSTGNTTSSSSSSSGKTSMLMLPDIQKVLQLEDGALWASIEELLCHCAGHQVRTDGIEYDVFINFLESGKIPPSKLPPGGEPDNGTPATNATVAAAAASSLPHPPSPAKPSLRVSTAATSDASPTTSSSSKQDPDEDRPTPLPSPHPYVVEPADSPVGPHPYAGSNNGGPAFFNDSHEQRYRDAGTLVTVRSSSSTGALHAAHGGKPLWKKKETTKMERVVEYTTIDADGVLQELVEHEVQETETLHMECKETGEFAHRETTEFKQKETFNKEVVSEQGGMEEYVHLKSLDDEIEFMER